MNAPARITAVEWDGRRITRPGIYAGLPIEDYHDRTDLFDGPSISSSGLRTIQREGPAAYWIGSPLNPDRVPGPHKAHFDLGRAAHTLLLGEHDFSERYAVRPDQWSDWRTKAAKEWRDAQREAGRTVLEPRDLETIRGMAGLLPWQRNMPESGLANSELVRLGLLEGDIERSVLWRDEETGVWLRARPDVIPRASGVVADLKTIGHGTPERAIFEHGYHQQAALVAEGLERVAGLVVESVVFVFVQTAPPYRVSIRELDAFEDPASGQAVDPLDIGRRQNRAALRTFKRCWDEGKWPAADGRAVATRMPLWAAREALEDIE